jgi:peptidoglycan/LPS O-acetylase OafA/YrhL
MLVKHPWLGTDYRADIDGLRAVAVILVVAFHAFPALVPGGFIGVDVFFVISGYLITGLILRSQQEGKFSIKSFYARRARRILPALSVVLAATLVIGGFVLLPVPYKKLGLHAFASAFFFPNFVYWSEIGYFDVGAQMKPLLHLWSLGVEEQFYLVWPLLLMVLRRMQVRPVFVLSALVAASLIYSSIEAFHQPAAAFYSPLSRLWELGAGSVLACMRINVPYPTLASSAGLGLIVGAALILTNTSPFPGLLAVIPVVGTAVVIAAGSRILSWRWLVALGLISYPLYLWHWPLLSLAAAGGTETGTIAKTAIVAVSFLLAWGTARYIEYPIRFGTLRPRGAMLSAASLFAVAIGAMLIFYSEGLLVRYPPEIRPVLATMDYQFAGPVRGFRCALTVTMSFESYQPECSEGHILVWGDSYSALLATGLRKPYAQFSRDGCLPLLTGGVDRCARSNAAVMQTILRLKPQRVVLFGAWLSHSANWKLDPTWNETLRSTLEELRRDIEDVIVVGPGPLWRPSLPVVVFRYWSEFGVLPDRIELSPENYRDTDAMLREISNRMNVHFVSIFDALCKAEGCLTHTPASRSQLLIWDHGHMTIEGAAYVVRRLGLDSSLPD